MFFGLITSAGVSLIVQVTLISALILYLTLDKIAASGAPEKDLRNSGKQAQDTYAWPELSEFARIISAEPYQAGD